MSYLEKSRYLQQNKPNNQQMTKEPFADGLFENNRKYGNLEYSNVMKFQNFKPRSDPLVEPNPNVMKHTKLL